MAFTQQQIDLTLNCLEEVIPCQPCKLIIMDTLLYSFLICWKIFTSLRQMINLFWMS